MSTLHASVTNRTTSIEKKKKKITNYHLTNPVTLHEALRTPSSIPIAHPYHIDGQKDLSQIGDAAIRLVLVTDGYDAQATRGQITEIHITTANNRYLARTGFRKGLDGFLYGSFPGDIVPDRVMATTVEAILGAVYVDSGESMGAGRRVGVAWLIL
ncbi:hypothetical protein BDV23DRAFT_180894 [Aspergillus alliaceus]|uniref:RNase III domain-containing protein n=1 Tax=Petromyces alliaceus TaxID=209559 RepID=A0A5N7CG11_PETAA|nr:hypothetical protein BDV23DRAFT_180894 [Aspergillus alliaceus]